MQRDNYTTELRLQAAPNEITEQDLREYEAYLPTLVYQIRKKSN